MAEILNLLPHLLSLMVVNILLGTYYNIGKQKINFDFKKLINGITKAIIIATSFLVLADCFEHTDLSILGVTPNFVMTTALCLYAGKSLVSLGRIFGINISEKIKKEQPTEIRKDLDNE